MFNHDLTAIENLDNIGMDTISLLKERMGYTDKLRCCNECKNYEPENEICKISNMGDIPVKPYATCEYYKRAAHVKPHASEAIYQYKVNDEDSDWITVEKQWYDNIKNAPNVVVQIIYPQE
jgi:hypothetical protein